MSFEPWPGELSSTIIRMTIAPECVCLSGAILVLQHPADHFFHGVPFRLISIPGIIFQCPQVWVGSRRGDKPTLDLSIKWFLSFSPFLITCIFSNFEGSCLRTKVFIKLFSNGNCFCFQRVFLDLVITVSFFFHSLAQ